MKYLKERGFSIKTFHVGLADRYFDQSCYVCVLITMKINFVRQISFYEFFLSRKRKKSCRGLSFTSLGVDKVEGCFGRVAISIFPSSRKELNQSDL